LNVHGASTAICNGILAKEFTKVFEVAATDLIAGVAATRHFLAHTLNDTPFSGTHSQTFLVCSE